MKKPPKPPTPLPCPAPAALNRLAELRGEFAQLVEHMQTLEHAAGVDALFAADGDDFGDAWRRRLTPERYGSPAPGNILPSGTFTEQ